MSARNPLVMHPWKTEEGVSTSLHGVQEQGMGSGGRGSEGRDGRYTQWKTGKGLGVQIRAIWDQGRVAKSSGDEGA